MATEIKPPGLRRMPTGETDVNSLADLLEWFLANDQRVGLVRHPHVEELFQWKQSDDEANDAKRYHFDSAEARFAIGVFQAIGENDTEAKLQGWITEVLQTLGEVKQTAEDMARDFKLDPSRSHVAEAGKIPTANDRRLYLTCSWLEALCTAEVRFLGWVFQELYGLPFQPSAK